MANHKATKKAIRQSQKRNERNRYYAKTMRNAYRDVLSLENKEEAQSQLPKLHAMLDKLAKKNIIHRNKAANLKSKITKRVLVSE